ncbi:hypothetical protein Hanom_Chr08g00682251 [Helianthus anomalus]
MKGALPFLAMIVSQVSQVGLTLAGKKAIQTGMQNFSYVFYSNVLTCLVLLPSAFLIHRYLCVCVCVLYLNPTSILD